jgi:hypothetical protein
MRREEKLDEKEKHNPYWNRTKAAIYHIHVWDFGHT